MILGRSFKMVVIATLLLSLSGCAGWQVESGTPGHEPPSGGNYNPVSHERNEGPN